MNAPDELRTAAERLEEQGQAEYDDARGYIGTHPVIAAEMERDGELYRAVAALLRQVQTMEDQAEDCPCYGNMRPVFEDALVVARVVAGDPT